MGGSGTQTIRYAPHIEQFHKLLLEKAVSAYDDLYDNSPYGEYKYYTVEDAFFGRVPGDPTRNYEVMDFPALFDMFGKFMAGLDVHTLWSDVYEDVIHGPEIAAAVSAQSDLVQNEIQTKVLPQFLSGMRDINAIQSTTFVIGKAIIADGHTRSINEFQTRLRLSAVELSGQLWRSHLDWDKAVVSTYAEMMKLYYATRLDTDTKHMEFRAKNNLWTMDLLDEPRAMLGVLNGAAAAGMKNRPSQAQSALAGALSGAAAGSAIAPGYGTAIGAVLGLGASFMQ